MEEIGQFVDEARDRGLGTLLSNPQTLKLLVAAVDAGNWPGTRTETFEAACRTLIHEPNEERLQAAPQRPDSEILRTVGHLCAVQLLSGQAGYRLPTTDGRRRRLHRPTRHSRTPHETLFLPVLRTKVFDVTDGLATPIHRHIAEFLAGRYLSALIDDHLPVRRVLALLTGDDGRTISGMRGLSAWFAAHCKAVRGEIMERDPLGTVLYGDVRNFTVGEKRYLLRCLERDAERDPHVFGALHELDSRWQDLATPDMEDTFREVLTRREGSQGKQTVALAVLRSLERNAVVPGVTSVLLDVVRDGRCWPAIRDAAFKAYVRQSRDEDDAQGQLKTLLADVYEGIVPDPLDDLLGLLLKELYPEIVPPSEVGRYLRERRSGCLRGTLRSGVTILSSNPRTPTNLPGSWIHWRGDSRNWGSPSTTRPCPTGCGRSRPKSWPRIFSASSTVDHEGCLSGSAWRPRKQATTREPPFVHGSANIHRPTRRWSAWRRTVFRTRRICTSRYTDACFPLRSRRTSMHGV